MVSIYRNNSANPASKDGHAIARWWKEAEKAAGDAAEQIPRKVQGSRPERVSGIELGEDCRLLGSTHEFVSVRESKVILRMHHKDAHEAGEYVGGKDAEYRETCSGKCAKDVQRSWLRPGRKYADYTLDHAWQIFSALFRPLVALD